MKALLYTAMAALVLCTAACGNGKKAAEAEKARQDSIAAAARADSIAKALADSVELAQMKAANDSLRAIRHAEDSATIGRLEPKFRFSGKEFLASTGVVYTPKAAPRSKTVDGLWLTFRRFDNRAADLEMHYQLRVTDDSDNIETVVLNIDGKEFEIGQWTDHDLEITDGSYTPYEDGTSSSLDTDLVEALGNAKSVKAKFTSSNFEATRTLTAAQVTALRDAVALYRAFK